MTKDTYSSFVELFKNEVRGTDYEIVDVDRSTYDLIMAPHGGYIEKVTSNIATMIAGEDKSLYCFEGLRPELKHHELHVTSHKYDEPEALAAASRACRVVAVHGRKEKTKKGVFDPETTWVGGLDTQTGGLIVNKLREAGYKCETRKGELGGTHQNNICNRGQASRGVQLEVPRSLRDKLFATSSEMLTFCNAIREALATNQ